MLTLDDISKQGDTLATFLWLAVLFALSAQLNELGFMGYVGERLASRLGGLSWPVLYVTLIALYVGLHYFFVSQTSQMLALLAVFLDVGIRGGVPPALMAPGLLFASSYFSVITPQGGSQNIIFVASGYLKQGELYKLGLFTTVAFMAMYLLIGTPWLLLRRGLRTSLARRTEHRLLARNTVDWFAAIFAKYPELPVFLVVGIGYWVGGFKFRGFGLGPVTGSLIVGVLVGYFFKVPISSTAKSILFLMFLFSIGYSVGPKFFQAMKGDGLRWAGLAAFICAVGLGTAFGVAKFLQLDPGFAAGLLSGALTESPAIGTATEAIGTLALPEAERARLVSHIAVADALCYLFGTFGLIMFCSEIGPRLLGIDLKAEAQKLEKELGLDRSQPGVFSAWRPFEMRGYRLPADARIAGMTVAQAEAMVPGMRVFIERIRRGGQLMDAAPDTQLQGGDIVVVSGRREALVEIIGRTTVEEVEDREALDVPTATYDVFVSSDVFAGKTLEEIARSSELVRGVFLRGIRRGGHEIPVGAAHHGRARGRAAAGRARSMR